MSDPASVAAGNKERDARQRRVTDAAEDGAVTGSGSPCSSQLARKGSAEDLPFPGLCFALSSESWLLGAAVVLQSGLGILNS